MDRVVPGRTAIRLGDALYFSGTAGRAGSGENRGCDLWFSSGSGSKHNRSVFDKSGIWKLLISVQSSERKSTPLEHLAICGMLSERFIVLGNSKLTGCEAFGKTNGWRPDDCSIELLPVTH